MDEAHAYSCTNTFLSICKRRWSVHVFQHFRLATLASASPQFWSRRDQHEISERSQHQLGILVEKRCTFRVTRGWTLPILLLPLQRREFYVCLFVVPLALSEHRDIRTHDEGKSSPGSRLKFIDSSFKVQYVRLELNTSKLFPEKKQKTLYATSYMWLLLFLPWTFSKLNVTKYIWL